MKFVFSILKVFLCHNRTYEYKDVAEILSHELLHAFDYCRANIDIENNYQVACSEVRFALSINLLATLNIFIGYVIASPIKITILLGL